MMTITDIIKQKCPKLLSVVKDMQESIKQDAISKQCWMHSEDTDGAASYMDPLEYCAAPVQSAYWVEI